MSYCFTFFENNNYMYTFTKNNTNHNKLLVFYIFFCIFLCFFAIFSSFSLFSKDIINAENKYYYTNKIEHLFTHCLIAYPEIAFSKNNFMSKHYMSDCITAYEFLQILNELYKNNYILVNINSCFKVNQNGITEKQKIKVPIGKKPLIFGFDDVNYDHKKIGRGMVDKIIIDKNGKLASSTKFGNTCDIRYDVEFIPILEEFISLHPDFSLNGAKGVINLTGYDGILGYRTCHSNITNRHEEIKQATEVVNKLKDNGWVFASHSYGHYHMNKLSYSEFEKELQLWNEEVKPIVGETQVYVYPYGEWQVFENGNLCDKHKLLTKYGFTLFCGVGMKSFFSYLPNNKHKVLFMDRKCVDGTTLCASRNELIPFFNPRAVIDAVRSI